MVISKTSLKAPHHTQPCLHPSWRAVAFASLVWITFPARSQSLPPPLSSVPSEEASQTRAKTQDDARDGGQGGNQSDSQISAQESGIQLMPRQMMVIREGLDAVFGQIMFVVRNNAAVPLPYKFRVLMPKETSDFSPREGLEAGEVVLADSKTTDAPASGSQEANPKGASQGFEGLVVDKIFPPGVHMMTIGFKVDAHFGSTTLTMIHPDGIKNLNVLSLKEGRVAVSSPGLVKNTSPDEADPLYDALELKSPIDPKQTLTIQVTGIPEGRTRLWWMGGIFGGILLGLATILALRTRPQVVADVASTSGNGI